MTKYILVNQNHQILDIHLQWKTHCPAREVFTSPHKDVALNQLIELNSANVNLRARVHPCETDDKGLPFLPAMNPPPDQQVA